MVGLAAAGMEVLVELNNRYALDGQDPNSYTGIAWIFGRYAALGCRSVRSSATFDI